MSTPRVSPVVVITSTRCVRAWRGRARGHVSAACVDVGPHARTTAVASGRPFLNPIPRPELSIEALGSLPRAWVRVSQADSREHLEVSDGPARTESAQGGVAPRAPAASTRPPPRCPPPDHGSPRPAAQRTQRRRRRCARPVGCIRRPRTQTARTRWPVSSSVSRTAAGSTVSTLAPGEMRPVGGRGGVRSEEFPVG